MVLCSNPLYISQNILNLKNVTFLNRHSSYLPYNAGVWPIFYSIAQNKNFTGVTIHLMNDLIDSGKIIKQEKINLFSKNLFELYKVCFEKSVELSIESIFEIKKKLKNFDKIDNKIKNKINYNSFLLDEDWKRFRKNGGVFVKWKNLFKIFF